MEFKCEDRKIDEASFDRFDDLVGIHRAWSLIVNRWVRVIHEIFSKWEIPITSLKVLLYLRLFQKDAEPSVIADSITVPRQTMTSILDSMEEDGLIIREPHPSDRRKKCIHFSSKGRTLADSVLKEIRRYEAQAMQVLTEHELRVMLRAMQKFSEAMERCVAEGVPTPDTVVSTINEEKV